MTLDYKKIQARGVGKYWVFVTPGFLETNGLLNYILPILYLSKMITK